MLSGMCGRSSFYLRWSGRLPKKRTLQKSPERSERLGCAGGSPRSSKCKQLQELSITEAQRVAGALKAK